jgi:hypothetical protein
VTTAVSLTIACVLIDFVGYFVLPQRFTASFLEYKSNPSVSNQTTNLRYYYKPVPDRGFDIAEYASGYFAIENISFPVFANSPGCFDKNDIDTFTSAPYVYFAGDSFTWGYAPYESKFVTRFEALTGIPTAKCGVKHTSTVHQF